MLLVAVATLLGATLQSATGFGFALILAPALFAALSPAEALTTLLILGASLNALVLFTERRPRAVRWRQLVLVLVAAAPGLLLGAVLLEALSKPTLQVAVGLAVIAGAVLQARQRSAPKPALSPGRETWMSVGTGILVGALTTTTSTNGPPLVLWFQRLAMTPGQLRDSIAAALLPLNVVGLAALTLIAEEEQAFEPGTVALLLALTVVGHVAGRRLFERLSADRFHAVAVILVFVAGIASVADGMGG